MRNLKKRHFFDCLTQIAERMLHHHRSTALIHAFSYANGLDESKHDVKWARVGPESQKVLQGLSMTAAPPHAAFAKQPMPICASPEMIGLRASDLRETSSPLTLCGTTSRQALYEA